MINLIFVCEVCRRYLTNREGHTRLIIFPFFNEKDLKDRFLLYFEKKIDKIYLNLGG